MPGSSDSGTRGSPKVASGDVGIFRHSSDEMEGYELQPCGTISEGKGSIGSRGVGTRPTQSSPDSTRAQHPDDGVKVSSCQCCRSFWSQNPTTEPLPSEDRSSLQYRMWRFLEDPTSSSAARCLSITVLTFILISTITLLVESTPQFFERYPSVFGGLEIAFITVFTLEYVTRFLFTYNRLLFLKDFLNLVDLAAILPFYIELLSGTSGLDLRVLRIVRIIRVFRIFKLSRYMEGLRLFGAVLKQSMSALLIGLIYLFILLMIFSTCIWYAERGSFNIETRTWNRCTPTPPRTCERSPFQSIPESFWWCITTMTTVGYGDVVPLSDIGRAIAGLCMLCGILVIALPTSIIASNFVTVWEDSQKHREAELAERNLELSEDLQSESKPLVEDRKDSNDSRFSSVFSHTPSSLFYRRLVRVQIDCSSVPSLRKILIVSGTMTIKDVILKLSEYVQPSRIISVRDSDGYQIPDDVSIAHLRAATQRVLLFPILDNEIDT